MILLLYLLVLAVSSGRSAQSSDGQSGRPFDLPIYWINLDRMTTRSEGMRTHLEAIGAPYHKRIPALTAATCNLLMIESPCMRVNVLDIAIMCSHLNALYEALHDPAPFAEQSDYFVVLEDDVRFLWSVDFQALIAQAPKDFGSLQLMLSHRPHINDVWEEYATKDISSSVMFPARYRNASVWSAQAILYRKNAIREFIDAAVVPDRRTGKRGFKMVNSFQYDKLLARQPSSTSEERQEVLLINAYRPVIACECLFADMFLYAMARPSFYLALPILNSLPEGMSSTIHQDHVQFHMHGFVYIETLFEQLIERFHDQMSDPKSHPLPWPSFLLSPLVSTKTIHGSTVGRLGPAEYNLTQWRTLAKTILLEPWVFSRIYGDPQHDNVDPHHLQYMKDTAKSHGHHHKHRKHAQGN